MLETEVVEKTEETGKSKEEWDTERQRADMAQANFVKVKAEKEQLVTKLTAYEEKVTKLEGQIKQNQAQISIGELDPLRADVPDLVNQNKKLIDELRSLKNGYTQLQAMADDFKKKEQQRETEQNRLRAIDKVCKPLDEEYGAKYRNKAIEMAEAAVNEGKDKTPDDTFDAYKLLERFYRKLKKDDETKKKVEIPTDSGTGAFSFAGTEIKEGSLNDVVGQMRKKMQK